MTQSSPLDRRDFLGLSAALAASAALPSAALPSAAFPSAALPSATRPTTSALPAPIGWVKARNARSIASSPWGIQASTLDPALLARAGEIGVKWTRLQASWPEVESVRGVYRWDKLDEGIRAVREVGITPFVCLAGGNRVYSPVTAYDDPKLAEVYGPGVAPPTASAESMRAFLAFVRAVVSRYSDRVSHWEIWNEPNHPHYWGTTPDAAAYGRMVRETAAVIRDVAPSATVLAGALAGLDAKYVEGFLAGGAERLVDIVTFHNYGAIPEERIYPGVEVRAAIDRVNPRIQLWQGECGYPSHSSTRDYRGRGPWGVKIQAKWLLRQSFTDTFFVGATMSNYFKLFDGGRRSEMPKRNFLTPVDSVLGYPERGGARVKVVGVNEKCLLSNPDLAPKPGFYAYQNLCAVMDGRYAAAKTPHTVKVLAQGDFYGIGDADDAFPSVPLVASFRDGPRALAAYWLPWYPAENLANAARVALELPQLRFEQPVLVDLLDGSVHAVTHEPVNARGSRFPELPLADYPFVLVERNAIEIVNR